MARLRNAVRRTPGGNPTARRAAAAALTLGVALVLTACGDGSSGTTQPAAEAAEAVAALDVDLAVLEQSPLGPVVVDADGFTLYRFDSDTAEPPATNCTGDCLALWPAAVAPDAPELEGIDAALVGAVTRDDGTEQLTLGGWPLYRYAADQAPGDASGQGVDGLWWAVTPAGEKAETASPSGGFDY